LNNKNKERRFEKIKIAIFAAMAEEVRSLREKMGMKKSQLLMRYSNKDY